MKKWMIIVSILIMFELILTSCARKAINIDNWTELVEKEELVEKAEGYEVLHIDTGVGNIELAPSKDNLLCDKEGKGREWGQEEATNGEY
jgi:hypothetical protein